ncbi:MAG TPA: hydrolase, partial [Bacteroidetes bacterium]|nr:hydrolase [Bacteroidota bacterium]
MEMAIPFKSIRYNSDVAEWQINFARNDQKQNEMSTWGRVPINFNVASIPFSGKLIWDQPPPKAGLNYSLIPYIFTSTSQDFENNENDYSLNAGLDAKLAVTSSLNLDLTINPDYSQVEVDKQVLNLSRYSIYYPEKRHFFIENSDLFSQFGFRQIRPFFSRKIGLSNGQQVPIIAGTRLSGNLNNNWRIGIMNMLTNDMPELDLIAQNYSVAAAQRKIFSGSNIGFIMVNRQGINNSEIIAKDYNRILGMDFNFASKDNSWVGKVFYHHAFDHEKLKENYAHASYLQYRTRSLFVMWNHEYAGKNYIADVGFVPRLNNYDESRDTIIRQSFWRIEPDIAYGFYPKNSFIYKHGPQLYLDYYADSSFHLTDRKVRLGYLFEFMNKSEIYFARYLQKTKLLFPIDITGQGATPLPADIYDSDLYEIKYKSNQRKRLYGKTNLKLGSFYNGNITTYGLSLSYRKQPWGIFT